MAVDKILVFRQSEKPAGVRTRILPALNKNAKKYYETIGMYLWVLQKSTKLEKVIERVPKLS